MTLNELRDKLIKQARVYVYDENIANQEVAIPGTNVEIAYNPFTSNCFVNLIENDLIKETLFTGNRENATRYIAENVFLIE